MDTIQPQGNIRSQKTAETVIRITLISLAGLAGIWRLLYDPRETLEFLLPDTAFAPTAAAALIVWVFCMWVGLMVLLAKSQPRLYEIVNWVVGMEGLGMIVVFWLLIFQYSPRQDIILALLLSLIFLNSVVQLLFLRKKAARVAQTSP